MPIDAEVKITGLDNVVQMLDQLTPKQTASVIRQAVRAGDDVFLAAVREEAPVQAVDSGGNSLPPGFLAGDISARVTQVDGAFVGTVRPGKLSAHVAKWVEEGHRIVTGGRSHLNKKTGKTSGKGTDSGRTSIPNPFFSRAFESSLQPALDATRDSIVNALKKKKVIK